MKTILRSALIGACLVLIASCNGAAAVLPTAPEVSQRTCVWLSLPTTRQISGPLRARVRRRLIQS